MKTKFLVADEIRPEAEGKQTVLGLFADDIITMQTPAGVKVVNNDVPPGTERLSFLINFSDLPPGEHTIKAHLQLPSGERYKNVSLDDKFKVEEGKTHTVVFAIKPFIVYEGAGIYKWIINVDGEELSHNFEIRLN